MKVEIELHGQKLNSFEEIIEKTINAKDKSIFRPGFYTCKID